MSNAKTPGGEKKITKRIAAELAAHAEGLERTEPNTEAGLTAIAQAHGKAAHAFSKTGQSVLARWHEERFTEFKALARARAVAL